MSKRPVVEGGLDAQRVKRIEKQRLSGYVRVGLIVIEDRVTLE